MQSGCCLFRSERPPHPHGVSLCVPCPCRSQLVLQRPGSLLCSLGLKESTGSGLREGGLEWRAMAHLCVEALGSGKGLVLFSQRGRGWRRRLQGEVRRGEARRGRQGPPERGAVCWRGHEPLSGALACSAVPVLCTPEGRDCSVPGAQRTGPRAWRVCCTWDRPSPRHLKEGMACGRGVLHPEGSLLNP